MPKRKQPKPKLALEGNGDGDYISLELVNTELNLVEIKAGHCCVTVLDESLPVEVITAIFSEWLIAANGDIEQGIKNVWKGNEDYASKLIELYRLANN